MALVEKGPELIRIPLNYEERTGHLSQLLHDVIARLRLDKGTKAPTSAAAGHHGDLRRRQGLHSRRCGERVPAPAGQHFHDAA